MSLMPAVSFGHGNPMNALEHNGYTERWSEIGAKLPRPKAVLCVSAHWYIPGAAVTISSNPRTIHDFGGFPRELDDVAYPAPGDPALARRVPSLLAPLPVTLDDRWGLDHGTWSVLCHVYPKADIPIAQLSIDETRCASFHYDIGQRLAPLRERASSSLAAATSCTTSTPTPGDNTPSIHSLGPSVLSRRPESASERRPPPAHPLRSPRP